MSMRLEAVNSFRLACSSAAKSTRLIITKIRLYLVEYPIGVGGAERPEKSNGRRPVSGRDAREGGRHACAAARPRYRKEHAKIPRPDVRDRRWQKRRADPRRVAVQSSRGSASSGKAARYATPQRIPLRAGESAVPRAANLGKQNRPGDACGRKK